VVTVWTGPETIGDYVVPAVTSAAASAGRPDPRVVASVILAVTADPGAVRDEVANALGAAGGLPSYRVMLDRQGRSGVQELVVAGDERTVERALRSYADAGTTELAASLHGGPQVRARTLAFLADLRARP
jgi:hypothetical protein